MSIKDILSTKDKQIPQICQEREENKRDESEWDGKVEQRSCCSRKTQRTTVERWRQKRVWGRESETGIHLYGAGRC